MLPPFFPRDACILYNYYVHTYIFSFSPPPLHWARLRALGLTWPDFRLTIQFCHCWVEKFYACLGACENWDDSAVLGSSGLGAMLVDSCLRGRCCSMVCAYIAGWRPTCRWRPTSLANVLLATLWHNWISLFAACNFSTKILGMTIVWGQAWIINVRTQLWKFGQPNVRLQNECVALKTGSFSGQWW